MLNITNYFDAEGNLLRRITTERIVIKAENTLNYGETLTKPVFEDVIFEDNVKDAVKLIIENSKKMPTNILLWGSAGTGKTTTGKMLAVELDRPFVYLNGQMSQKKVLEIICNLKPNSLVLFDEIHNMPDRVAEIMYPAIQDGEIGLDGRVIKLDNIMFVATTTEPQMLPKPLKDRFKQVELEELGKDKLKILLNKQGVQDKVIEYLLNHTTNIRIINNLLEMVLLYGDYTEENLIKVFRLKKINLYNGLSDLQTKYLDILKKQTKPTSLRALCLMLSKSEDYLKLEVEGELIKKELIIVTSRGREINPVMKESLENIKEPPKFDIDSRQVAIDYLNNNPQIKNKFGSRYLELVNWLAEKIDNGISPDTIDIYSFGNDIDIEQSFDNNYLEDL
jgi:Holliday junction resolvasome RuvABC ATP-dependent DNA helicase subunit